MIDIRTGELTHMVVDKYGGDRGAENLAKYIPLTQVASSTGGANNIADVMVLGAWKSSGNLLEGFEVKISRADWLNEVKAPNKCMATKQYCDRWWLVISNESMVKEGELPEDWGMMTVVEDLMGVKSLKIVKQALQLTPIPMSHDFVASLLRTDARGQIAIDVHNDKMKDLERKYEAEYKNKYAGLLSFIKEMNKELGIKIEHNSYRDSWYAQIDNWEINRKVANGSHELTPKQLAEAVKIALSGDMRTIKYRLESVASAAEEVLKIAKEFAKDDA